MDKEEVDVVGAQLLERILNGGLGLLIAGVGYPYLACDKNILASYAAVGNSLADGGLVLVGLGRIEETIAHVKGFLNHVFALVAMRQHYAQTDHGHFSP